MTKQMKAQSQQNRKQQQKDEGGQDVQEVDDPLNDSLAVAELESSL